MTSIDDPEDERIISDTSKVPLAGVGPNHVSAGPRRQPQNNHKGGRYSWSICATRLRAGGARGAGVVG